MFEPMTYYYLDLGFETLGGELKYKIINDILFFCISCYP